MNVFELLKYSKVLLIKIHVITGWTIPEEELKNVLVDQFQKKLVESYQSVNVDEIEYAFRTYGTTIKDWGKTMNLSLIDEVMIPYLAARVEVSRYEESKRQLAISDELSEVTDEELLKSTVAYYEKIKNYKLIPESVFFYLEKKGELVLTNDQKVAVMDRATKNFWGQEVTMNTLKCEARKLAVADYFETLRQ